MGAQQFTQEAKGKTAKEAFDSAVAAAAWDHGHAGYTGSCAEKHEFVMIPYPDASVNVYDFIDKIMEDENSPVDDKWGPAGCIEYAPGDFIFFGWASS